MVRRKVARRQLPGCVPFGLSDREFLILREKDTDGGAEVYTQVRKLDLRLDRGRTPCGFLGQILVCPCSNQLLWRLQRYTTDASLFTTWKHTYVSLTILTVRISLPPSWLIACDLVFQSRLIVISSFRCFWQILDTLGMKTYRNVHLIRRVFDRSLVKCKICIIVRKGRNKDRIYQRCYLFSTQLHAVKVTKEKLQSNRYMFSKYSFYRKQ